MVGIKKISELLGIKVSKNTVGILLKEMDYSLRANSKKNSNGEKKLSAKEKKDRDKQFIYINNLRNAFATGNNAVISVDTKKKELIGNFKNPGKVWGNKEQRVNDHDFASYAIGKAIPYSIYRAEVSENCLGYPYQKTCLTPQCRLPKCPPCKQILRGGFLL